MRFVQAQKVIRKWTCIVRPLAEVKIGPPETRRIKDAVVPREKRHYPELVETHRARDHVEISAELQNALQLLDRVVLDAADPEFVIAGREE